MTDILVIQRRELNGANKAEIRGLLAEHPDDPPEDSLPSASARSSTSPRPVRDQHLPARYRTATSVSLPEFYGVSPRPSIAS